jgi:hypothetical protein
MGEALAVQRYTLMESIATDAEKLKLPLPIMVDVGPAVQTFGGLVALTNRETFCPVATIAGRARVPIATCRKHLVTLDHHGWIKNQGRQHTRRGSPRRTATISISPKAIDAMKLKPDQAPDCLDGHYGLLPWWACCSIRRLGRLPWCGRAVLSVVLARLAAMKLAAIRQQEQSDEEVLEFIESAGGNERFRFSIRRLRQQTGLSHDSVTTAKRLLNHRFHILRWITQPKNEGGVTRETDYLVPNWDLVAQVTPASRGRCFLDLGTCRDPHAKTG